MTLHCLHCGIEISPDAIMCQTCAPKNPAAYERQRELLTILTPLVISKARGSPVIAIKPLLRQILDEVSLEEMHTNRSTASRLIRYTLEGLGYRIMEDSSQHSVWMTLSPISETRMEVI